MLLWSYFAAVLTEPGRVPPGWQPSEGDEEARACAARACTAPVQAAACHAAARSPAHAV